MVQTVSPDGNDMPDAFANAGPKPLDRIDMESGAWLAPNEATRQALRTSYIAWLDADRPATWPPEKEDPTVVAERNRSLKERVIEKATGAKVKIVDRYARPADTVTPPPSFDEDGEWTDWAEEGPRTNAEAPEGPEGSNDPPEPPERATDREAGLWSREHGIPRHRKERPSQTYKGRRGRFLAADVENGHCRSIQQAAQRHPPRGPQPKKPTKE